MMHASNNAGATGQAIINSVDLENKAVNLTHGPIPALSWPEMTMDLPVASGVALSDVQAGDAVLFRVVLGDDQVYRITEIDVMP
jgi:Cu/Ag efflux protein CusF